MKKIFAIVALLFVIASQASAQIINAERFRSTTGPCVIRSGSGSPEGSVTGNVCDVYLRSNGGTDTTVYVKSSGTGNTGWLSLGSGSSAWTNPISSASVASNVSDETGTAGSLVFSNSPALVAPVLGDALATSLVTSGSTGAVIYSTATLAGAGMTWQINNASAAAGSYSNIIASGATSASLFGVTTSTSAGTDAEGTARSWLDNNGDAGSGWDYVSPATGGDHRFFTDGYTVASHLRGTFNSSGLTLKNGSLLVPDGTTAVPTLAFSSQPGTGFHLPLAGFVTLGLNTSARYLWGGGEFRVGSGVEIGWSTNADPELAGNDVSLARGGSNQLLMKNAVLFQLVGNTSSFPALKRNSTDIDVRLADDSGYTSINAKGAVYNPTAAGGGTGVARIGSGNGNGFYWGHSVTNAAGTDSMIFAQASSAYTTGGTFGWVGNSNAFLYYPSTFVIGTGVGATPTLKLDPSLNATFGGGIEAASASTIGISTDTLLARDAANVFAMKNGANAQTLRLYGTTTGPKYLSLGHDGTNGVIDTAASSGTISIAPTNATSVTIGKATTISSGDVTATTGSFIAGSSLRAGSGGFIFWNTRSVLRSSANGQMQLSNNATTVGAALDFNTADTLKVRNLAENADGTLTAGIISANTSLKLNSVLADSVTAPTIASGGCTSPAVTHNNGTAAFLITIGTSCTGVQTFVLTMPAAAHFWACSGNNNTSDAQQSSNYIVPLATSTTAVTFTSYDRVAGTKEDFTASDTYLIQCRAE